ncbi:MAG: amidohydrolase [Candidatus Moranbacteria bacterium]|nr:amidohydrolase [Candidatus Moranbacteria bacterium]
MNGIIDMHAHVTARPLEGLHVSSAMPAVLRERAEASGVTHVIALATSFPYKRSGMSARSILELTGRDPFFSVFGTVDMTLSKTELENEFDGLESSLRAGDISGIKLYPGYQEFSPSDRSVYPLYEIARAHAAPVMIHGGDLQPCCGRTEHDRREGSYRCGYAKCPLERDEFLTAPKRVLAAARAFPDVVFVIAHLGNPFFDELRSVMMRCRNVYTDTSGQIRTGWPEEDNPRVKERVVAEISEMLRVRNGMERVLFGSDFPVQSYADSVDFIDRLPITSSEKDMILFRNARAILNL